MSTTGSVRSRPLPLSSKSFARYEPASPVTSPPRSRASTISTLTPLKSPTTTHSDQDDVFEKPVPEGSEPPSPTLGRSHTLPDRFDELPIELVSLTDRFVDALQTKTYPEPLKIDQLSDLFQEFYVRASSAIAIHISALRSRLNRDPSPAPSKASARSRTIPSKPSHDSLRPRDATSNAQQMLTASEVTEKRKQRKLLEYKRIVLEEAVEKRVCEKIYDKLWRHKSTLDEVRDEKLRSKTAALALVGIGLKDLGIDIGPDAEKTTEDLQASLEPAREGLAKMNEEKSPLGKLQHLTAAHKAIVDTLYTIYPSSSSADEILPTLIYTLITSPVEGINIISNLYFIQRFRAATRVDGEAAYCLTNLEAAISFLENVDLASLRADEHPEGPRKLSTTDQDQSEKLEAFPSLPISASQPATPTTATTNTNATGSHVESSPSGSVLKPLPEKSAPPTTRHQRTLSDILHPITTANKAVQSTAEEGFKNISSTLDNSFKFLMGKLKERGSEDSSAEVIVPKTLDEARQLVSRPLTPDEDDPALSESSSLHDGTNTPTTSNLTRTEDRILSLLGGRKPGTVRDRSADSVQSNGSGRRSTLHQTTSVSSGDITSTNTNTKSSGATPMIATPQSASTNPLDTVKNFGGSLNPINHIGSAFGGAFGRFGSRASASASPPTPNPLVVIDKERKTSTSASSPDKSPYKNIPKAGPGESDSTANQNLHPLRLPKKDELEVIKAAPPISRFMTSDSAAELKIGDVQDLLDDYQRLARVLGQLIQRASTNTSTVQDVDENSDQASDK
ncbi:hypothetical protein PV10_07062 [Exophiala mesophila]|uniref:VPS9 domain-containing protein n=1 Tax=Exophiala mesophila TaxID=212818 RepID=A0A0D1Z704_EXOME|nr:uncharacterized protein PV10_07062 [Exophiala mesophila]KIV89679.1 hypothetical protein PV10_07062 [Exophiala mesophila]